MTADQPARPLDVAAIRTRAESATEGPWWAWDRGVGYEIAVGRDTDEYGRPVQLLPAGDRTDIGRQADAEFVAAARADVPALLDALAAAHAEIERLRAVADAAIAWRHARPGAHAKPTALTPRWLAELIDAVDKLTEGSAR